MALSSCPTPILIKDSSLTDWTVIGSGGFGQIFKARHLQWCCDVAVKLLHYDDGTSTSLLREIDMMRTGSSPYVIQVLGVFKGRLPGCGLSVHLGLVMEVMERGSLATLQSKLRETPPLPLAFRLAHQVALGINFLHNLSPALLHLDLKPNNVLLDSYLNAKLTDFGLARFYHSVSQGSKKNSDNGGTNSYKPPEAFDMSYAPTRASDIYSYGILLWSILTGKEPYANAMSSLVRFRIPQGDRPSLDEITCQAGRTGVTGLINLMVRCWEAKPSQRPSSHECTLETEELYKMHKHTINDAVHTVLKKLDENNEESLSEQVQRIHITEASAEPTIDTQNHGDNELPCHTPVQEMADGWNAYHKDNATSRDGPPSQLQSAFHDELGHSSIEPKFKMSSVHPIQSPTPSPPNGNSPHNKKTTIPQQDFSQNLNPQYQRQSSIPDALLRNPASVPRGLHIHMSHVTGFQLGDNNNMVIYGERRRHPTAPSSINSPRTNTASRRDKTGGVS